jgi:hypothetical protein
MNQYTFQVVLRLGLPLQKLLSQLLAQVKQQEQQHSTKFEI